MEYFLFRLGVEKCHNHQLEDSKVSIVEVGELFSSREKDLITYFLTTSFSPSVSIHEVARS